MKNEKALVSSEEIKDYLESTANRDERFLARMIRLEDSTKSLRDLKPKLSELSSLVKELHHNVIHLRTDMQDLQQNVATKQDLEVLKRHLFNTSAKVARSFQEMDKAISGKQE